MTHCVVVADRIGEAGLDLLRSSAGFRVVSTVGQSDQLAEVIKQADALIVRSDTWVTADLISRAPRLRVIARAGIGVDNIDVATATRRGVAVVNAPGANTVSAAEHTVALLLSLLRRVPWAAESMRRGEWDRKRFGGAEVRGKVLGLVGIGRVGQLVARLTQAFGMQVVAHDPYISAEKARDLRIELLPLDDLLGTADVVSLHVPANEDTRQLMNRARLAKMKPSSVLVNTARGALVDDTALLEALEQGNLAGAALDVFDPEPLPANSPLRTSDRVLLTPHLAASTAEAQERVSVEICQTVRNALLSGDIGSALNVPGISGEVLARSQPTLDLARRTGRLAFAIGGGRVEGVEVYYGGDDDHAPRAVMLAAVEGILCAMGVGPVSLVNAASLADERGITIGRRVGPAVVGYTTTVGVTVQTHESRTMVHGALVANQIGRVIGIDDFAVDIPLEGPVLVLRNRDVPGVIGRVGTCLGAAGINIGSYHQARREPGGAEALAAIVVDQAPTQELLAKLEALEDVLEVRCAHLDEEG
jgi:D-3-phosphoglycerate dehydrogenase